MTFYRTGTTKAMVLGSTDLTFYKSDGSTTAATIGANGLVVSVGEIGGISITSTKMSSDGFEFNSNGHFTLGSSNRGKISYDGTKMDINANTIEMGASSQGSYLLLSDGVNRTTNNDTFVMHDFIVRKTGIYMALNNTTSGNNIVGDASDGFSSNNKLKIIGSSSIRYKDHIRDMTFDDAKAILNIKPVWFKYKDGYLWEGDELLGKPIPGFYAENVEEAFPVGVYHRDGLVENWEARRIIPAMLMLIQHQQKEIEALKER